MATQDYFGSDHQLFKNSSSAISFRQGPSSNLSHSIVQMPNRNGQYLLGSINMSVQSNPTNSGTSFDESSLITCLDSSVYEGSFSQGFGFNYVGSPASISGDLTVDQLPAHGPHFSVTDHQGSIPPPVMMFNNTNNPPLLDNLQLNYFNDYVVASKMLRQQQHPHQQQQNPYQQQQNPNQQLENRYLQHQNPYQQQHNPHQPLFRPVVQPQQPANAGLAVKRLISYVQNRRNRPPDNNIGYWRSFVKNFYSPLVKKSTCFSNYARLGRQAYSDFVKAETWKCNSCGSTSGKGFVETFDVLPRMNQLYFNSSGGVIDELLCFEMLAEISCPDGFMMVHSKKAVQETNYNHCRVVHQGELTVMFNPELQITSWNFCVQHHEVLLPNKLIASQVNSIINFATEKGCDGVQRQKLLSNANWVARRKLLAIMEQSHVCELGFSKHFVRSLKISEVLNSMKDLMDFSQNSNTSPIETLKRYGRESSNVKHKTRYVDSRSRMKQTPGPPELRKFPAQNVNFTGKTDHTFQTANYMAQAPINDSRSHYKKPPMAEQIIPGMYPSPCPIPSPYNRASSSLGPSSGRISPNLEQLMLFDVLAHMENEETTKRARSEKTRGSLPGGELKRSRVECSSQVINERGPDHTLYGKSENGSVLDSSCSSNSPRLFPDCSFFKNDGTDLDDDFTSPDQFVQQLS